MDEISDLKIFINTYLNIIFKVGLALVILATFFLFTNRFTEFYDTPKFLVLLIFTVTMLLFITLKFTISGKVILLRTPLDIPLLLLLVVAIISTVLSSSPYVALFGNQLKINDSLVSIVTLVLFYFVLVNLLKNIKIKWVINITIILSEILAVLSLLAYAGIRILPDPWIQSVNFTPSGSSFSTTAILALLLPFIVMQILSSSKPFFIVLNSVFLLISGTTIALTGAWSTWIAALLGLSLTIATTSSVRKIEHIIKSNPYNVIGLLIPLVFVMLIAALSWIPPIDKVQNPFYDLSQNFPRETQLGFIPSWKISVSAFRDSPFWGSGPSTYIFNYTNYKPMELNSAKTWNVRFDKAFNEYLQILGTLGGGGILAILSLAALFISSAYKTFITYIIINKFEGGPEKVVLAVSGLIFFIILALHTSTLPVWIMGILILAAYMTLNTSSNLQKLWSKPNDIKSTFLKIAGLSNANPSAEKVNIDALPGILLTISLGLILIGGYFGGKLVLADLHHMQALNAVSENQGIIAYNELVLAEKLNPWNDLYRTDLAQTNFALANAIATAKGPTEASPGGSFTDQDKQNIQILLQQSINEARMATVLSPKSALNWEILAILYKQISGVAQNALVFSLDSYGRAIQQDPFNPQLRVSVGGVYYAVKNYDLAIRFFTDAINLKSDFANGYYNLSVALNDKGDLENAKALAEKTLSLVDKDSPDYQTAKDYLTNLENKIGLKQELPAVQTDSALQEKNLPNVLNLPKPGKIATPAAITKPKPTPKPSSGPVGN